VQISHVGDVTHRQASRNLTLQLWRDVMQFVGAAAKLVNTMDDVFNFIQCMPRDLQNHHLRTVDVQKLNNGADTN